MLNPTRFPRLALPFTVLEGDASVHLVAGEEVRITLRTGAASRAIAGALRGCTGEVSLESLLTGVDSAERESVLQVLGRLQQERIIVEGPGERAPTPQVPRLVVEGTGRLADRLRAECESWEAGAASVELHIFCQDDLNLHAAREFNRRCLERPDAPWLWVSTGPAARGYVSPVFLPLGGACLECLLRHFQRLSPVPALYDELARHGALGGEFVPIPFPETATALLLAIVRWKRDELASPTPAAALYRLHVVETATHEVSTHRVFPDPTCPACRHG